MARITLITSILLLSCLLSLAGYLAYDGYTNPPRHGYPVGYFKKGNHRFVADHETGYRNRRNYQLTKKNNYLVDGESITVITPVIHDSTGARVDSPDLPALEQVDIIAVGGSLTWGQGVHENQTFPAVIAEKLGLTRRNYAISGSGGVTAYFEMKRRLKLKPKIVIYGFWQAHLNRNLRYCANTEYPFCNPLPRVKLDKDGNPSFEFPDTPEEKVAQIHDFFLTMGSDNPHGFALKDMVWAYRRLVRRLDEFLNPIAYDHASEDQKIDVTIFILREMAKQARNVGARLIVAYIPLYFSDLIQPAPSRLIDAAKRDGYLFVDTRKALIQLRDKDVAIQIKGDGHLTGSGHEAVAKAVLSKLDQNQF